VIWETVKSARAGVQAHVHALRAAFAVQFDEANPAQVIALKELMGHSRIDQTLVHLRRKNKAKAMEVVRDLSWGGAGTTCLRRERKRHERSPRPAGALAKRPIRDSNPCRRRERAVS
jgi:hypothetical protein